MNYNKNNKAENYLLGKRKLTFSLSTYYDQGIIP